MSEQEMVECVCPSCKRKIQPSEIYPNKYGILAKCQCGALLLARGADSIRFVSNIKNDGSGILTHVELQKNFEFDKIGENNIDEFNKTIISVLRNKNKILEWFFTMAPTPPECFDALEDICKIAMTNQEVPYIEEIKKALDSVQLYVEDPEFHDSWMKAHPKGGLCPTCGLFIADENLIRKAKAAIYRFERYNRSQQDPNDGKK